MVCYLQLCCKNSSFAEMVGFYSFELFACLAFQSVSMMWDLTHLLLRVHRSLLKGTSQGMRLKHGCFGSRNCWFTKKSNVHCCFRQKHTMALPRLFLGGPFFNTLQYQLVFLLSYMLKIFFYPSVQYFCIWQYARASCGLFRSIMSYKLEHKLLKHNSTDYLQS